MPVILPYPKTYKELKNKVKKCSNANSDYSCMDWYLCFVPDKNCKKDSSKSKIKTPSSKNSRPEITNPKFQPVTIDYCPNVNPIVMEYVLGNPENVDAQLLDAVIYALLK